MGFGSNLGNRKNIIRSAIKFLALNSKLNLLKLSSMYETEPWGYTEQNSFINCAAVYLSRLNVHQLFKLIKRCEKVLGRVKRPKWHSREIDIDILFWNRDIIKNKKLIIPHPQLQNRNFILKPLLEIIPEFTHPVLKKDIETLYNNSVDNCRVIAV